MITDARIAKPRGTKGTHKRHALGQSAEGKSGEALFLELAMEDLSRAADFSRHLMQFVAAKGAAVGRARCRRSSSRWS
jgi:hypothetical protein